MVCDNSASAPPLLSLDIAAPGRPPERRCPVWAAGRALSAAIRLALAAHDDGEARPPLHSTITSPACPRRTEFLRRTALLEWPGRLPRHLRAVTQTYAYVRKRLRVCTIRLTRVSGEPRPTTSAVMYMIRFSGS